MRLILESNYNITTSPVRVRLVGDWAQQNGITMQVFVNNGWRPICTLREDGTLGLWDVGNKDLRKHGFDMGGRTPDSFGSFISTHIQ